MKKVTKNPAGDATETAVATPRHIGIILDGNRRWARENNISPLEGHNHGLKRVEQVVREAFRLGVEVISLFVFSTENWRRTPREVNHLMKLFTRYFKHESMRLIKEGFRLKIAGQDNGLSDEIKRSIAKLEELSAKNSGPTVVLFFNYGGQTEILDMVKNIVKKGLKPDKIDMQTLQDELYLPEVPDLDLVIRTSGEQRLSGFQLWRAAYAEMLFVDKYWPDFTPLDLRLAIDTYCQRSRRFGS